MTGDFETRSAESIKTAGPARYSEHPTTYPLCLSYAFGLDEEVHVWNSATEGIEESPRPTELLRRLEQGWLFEAHNSAFEWWIWRNQMARRWGWPEVPRPQWRCTAARAAYHCLPRSLENLALVLRIDERKDEAGKGLIKALSKPTPVLKPDMAEALEDLRAHGASSRYFHAMVGGDKAKKKKLALCYFNENQGLIRQNWTYCQQDVRTERAASLEMPPMPNRELRVWQMDQEMNARGVAVDLDMAHAAIEMARPEVDRLNARLREIVPGVSKATQRAKVLAWMQSRVPYIPDTQAATLDKVSAKLKDKIEAAATPPDQAASLTEVREVIGIMSSVNRSSTAKYQAVLDRVCADGRARDLLMYAGAHTLRWTGVAFQPHNLPRGKIKDMESVAEVIKERDPEWLRFLHGDVMEMLSHALRGVLVAGRGKTLRVADFAAIEAHVVFWLARCATALAVFEREKQGGADIYCDMATRIYQREITKKNAVERQMGKQSILGLGFGMGFCKFLITLRKYNIKFTPDQVRAVVPDYEGLAAWVRDPSVNGGAQYVRRSEDLNLDRDLHELVLTKYVVDLYRGEYPEVPALWKALEQGAIRAVQTGEPVRVGVIEWRVDGRRLLAALPSGTCQTYWDPVVSWEPSPFPSRDGTRRKVAKLSVHGLDEKTRQWLRHGTYGGELTENLVQHIARDIMADAMVRIEDHPAYDNVLSVHDEEIAESLADGGDQKEFERLISMPPAWASDCPVEVEGWSGPRYKKA